jgi:hypothetical protein
MGVNLASHHRAAHVCSLNQLAVSFGIEYPCSRVEQDALDPNLHVTTVISQS